MKAERASDLKKALAVLLYDQYNCPDVDEDNHDETFVEDIVFALIENNGTICPFKNYGGEQDCECYKKSCNEGLDFDCEREPDDAWKSFIGIEKQANNFKCEGEMFVT